MFGAYLIIYLLIGVEITHSIKNNEAFELQLQQQQQHQGDSIYGIKQINEQNATNEASSTTRRMIGANNNNSTNNNAPSAVDRDKQLMSLLATRRNALVNKNPTGNIYNNNNNSGSIVNVNRQRGRYRQNVSAYRRNFENPTASSYSSSVVASPTITPPQSQLLLTPRNECEKNCTSNFTKRATASCTRRCVILYRNNEREQQQQQQLHPQFFNINSRFLNEKDTNSIIDELLDTEESQTNGLYVAHPSSSATAAALSASPVVSPPQSIINVTEYTTNETKELNNTLNLRYLNSTINIYDNNSNNNNSNSNNNNSNSNNNNNNSNNNNSNKNSNVTENEIRSTSTERIYSKIVRTTIDGRHKRTDPIRGRQRSTTTTTTTTTNVPIHSSTIRRKPVSKDNDEDDSLDESDLIPYYLFGQKLSPTPSRIINDSRNQVTLNPKKLLLDVTTSAKQITNAKYNANDEFLELSVSKLPSIDRNKSRRFSPTVRNVIANANNRRQLYNSGIITSTRENLASQLNGNVSLSTVNETLISNQNVKVSAHESQPLKTSTTTEIPVTTIVTSSTTIVTTSTIVSTTIPSTVAPNTSTTSTTTTTTDSTSTSSTQFIPSTPQNDELPSLKVIEEPLNLTENIEEDIDLENEDKTLTAMEDNTKPIFDSSITTMPPPPPSIHYPMHVPATEETPNLIVFLSKTTENSLIAEDIPSPAENVKTDVFISSSSISSSTSSSTSRGFTRTTISSSIRSTINPIKKIINSASNSNDEIMTTTTPQSKSPTTSTSNHSSSTSSSSISSSKLLTTTETPNSSPIANSPFPFNNLHKHNSTTFDFSSMFTNLPSSVTANMPALINLATILSNTSSTRSKSSTNTMNERSDEILLQRNNDVTIEMNRMNLATYILVGLGMIPIIIIILYIIKIVIFRKSSKVTKDLEKYIIDEKKQNPISPVVKLEHKHLNGGNLKQHIGDGDESIYSTADGTHFKRENLVFKNILGEGHFGQVWKAEAYDLPGFKAATRLVAVKTVLDSTDGGLREESEIMRKLGSHPNVVTLLGVCLEKEPHLIIMEFAMRGRLLSLLKAAKNMSLASAMGIGKKSNSYNIPSINSSSTMNITPIAPRRLAGFAHDIARGMEYITQKQIVHGDLATRNVLLDHNGICKICDFGMSFDMELQNQSQSYLRKSDYLKHRSSDSPEMNSKFHFDFNGKSKTETCKRPALPIRWMAPESLQYHVFSTESDVWAFGIVLWEIATLGSSPYSGLSGREVIRLVPTGMRPELPANCHPKLCDLMTRTWNANPHQRPSFTEARILLTHLLGQCEVEDTSSDYLDVSGFSEDFEHGMVYFNRRISEFECEI